MNLGLGEHGDEGKALLCLILQDIDLTVREAACELWGRSDINLRLWRRGCELQHRQPE